MAQFQILPDSETLAHAAAELFVAEARDAIAQRGQFSVALSGGSTPNRMYELLAAAPLKDQVAWDQVQVFWGDERCVPPDDEQSNYRQAHSRLLSQVPIPVKNLHRMQGEIDPAQAAEAYEQQLHQFFHVAPNVAAPPSFDLVLLGMGDDGHTASLFPGTPALLERRRWVVANYVPQHSMWRITLTEPAINAARQVAFLIGGAAKAARLKEVIEGPRDPERLPSQLIQPTDGKLLWMLDQAAAAELK